MRLKKRYVGASALQHYGWLVGISLAVAFLCACQSTKRQPGNVRQTDYIMGEGEIAYFFDLKFSNAGPVIGHSGIMISACDTQKYFCIKADSLLIAPRQCEDVKQFVRAGATNPSGTLHVSPFSNGRNREETIFLGPVDVQQTYYGLSRAQNGFVYHRRLGIVGYIYSAEERVLGSAARITREGLLRETRWIANAPGMFACDSAP